MRSALALCLLLFGCSKPAPGLVDGGGFVLPDAGVRDTGVVIPDSGMPDSGPFVCNPACSASEFCGCLAQDCGCHPPRQNNQLCDPQVPDSCEAGLSCVRARREGSNLHVCSDGSNGTSCSHTEDVCTTALGCVCLTEPSAVTDCRCTESVMNPSLCDNMVPESCPGNVCVRVQGPNGVYFVCSDGSPGSACDPAQDNCRTTIGCTCPLVRGVERCICSEPSGQGGPCDIDKPESCVSPLMCVVTGNMFDGRSTVCSSGQQPFPDGGIPCDPNNPGSCPPGQRCIEGPNGFTCV